VGTAPRDGWDHPDAVLGSPLQVLPGHPVHSYRRVGWSEVLSEEPALVLDVRRTDEHAAGHLPGALNIPLHELLARTEEVPDGPVWVHCGSGCRAGVAASVLDRAGRDVVHVDASFDEAAGAGLAVTTDAPE
jgi:hydroxyacylglutathione hydrolase